jgi:serine protease DegQ
MGIGFAIPVSLAKQVMEEILKNGSVIRGWIGVEPQNLSKELLESMGLPANTKGVLITGVLEGGPADRGGLKPGDTIIAVNDQSLVDVTNLLNIISKTKLGDKINILILRKNQKMNLAIESGIRPKLNQSN